MKTKTKLMLFAVALVLGAVAFFVWSFSSPGQLGEQNEETSANSQEQAQNRTATGDFEVLRSAIVTGDGRLRCEFSAPQGPGVIVVDGDNVSVTTQTSQGASYVVATGGRSYIWSQGNTSGYQQNGHVFRQALENSENDPSAQIFYSQTNPQFSCEDAEPESGVFDIPSDVTFETLS